MIMLCCITVVFSFLKLSCYLYMVHASQKGDHDTNIFFSFLIIYIKVPLYRRKFCDGHIILVFEKCLSVSHCVQVSEWQFYSCCTSKSFHSWSFFFLLFNYILDIDAYSSTYNTLIAFFFYDIFPQVRSWHLFDVIAPHLMYEILIIRNLADLIGMHIRAKIFFQNHCDTHILPSNGGNYAKFHLRDAIVQTELI